MASAHLVKYHYVSIKKDKKSDLQNMFSLTQILSGVIKKKSLEV